MQRARDVSIDPHRRNAARSGRRKEEAGSPETRLPASRLRWISNPSGAVIGNEGTGMTDRLRHVLAHWTPLALLAMSILLAACQKSGGSGVPGY
jgi:hypothetical protein